MPARTHGAERAHAAVGLELLAVDEDQVARRLVAAGEQRAEHDGVGAGDDGLGDVAGVLQAAVGDHRDAGRLAGQRRVVDGGDLRGADAGDDAGGADRAGTDADLDRVGTGVDEGLRAGAGGDVAADDLDVPGRGVGLEPVHHVEQQADVAVRGVGDQDVHAGLDERGGAVPGVAEVADRGADHEPAVRVLGGVGELLGLHEVLDGDEPGQPALASSTSGSRSRLCWRSMAVASSCEMPTGAVISGIGVMTSSTLVVPHSATGTKRRSRLVMMPSRRWSAVDDRQAGDAVLAAHLVELLEGGVRADRHGVGDHAGLGALDEVDLVGLVLDGEVAVQHAEAALAGHRDGHARLGDGVHRGRQQRDRDVQIAGQPGAGVDVGRHDVGLAGQQQDVVEGQSDRCELGGDAVVDELVGHSQLLDVAETPSYVPAARDRRGGHVWLARRGGSFTVVA